MNRNARSGKRLHLLALPLFGALGAAVVVASTPWGVGVGYDSYFYISAAENLLAGIGLGRISAEGQFIPLVHFPPLYPFVLSGVSWVAGMEVRSAARWLAAALMAANLVALVWVVHRAVGYLAWGAAAALLALASPSVIEQHLWAMSEPLFFLILLAAWAGMAEYLTRRSGRWLVLGAVAASLAYLTRYAGLAAIGSGLLALFLLGRKRVRDKFVDGAAFVGINAMIIAPWLWRNLRLQGTLTNRRISYHPIPAERLRQAGQTIADWMPLSAIPPEIRFVLVVIGVLVLGAVGLRQILRARSAGGADWAHHLMGAAGLFGFSYGVLLGISLLFFDASTRLDDRILSPLYWATLLVSIVIVGRSVSTRRGKALALVGLVLVMVPLAGAATTSVRRARQEGLGFHSRDWRQSETLEAVSRLPDNTLIYSNEAIPLMVLTGRSVHAVPERLDPVIGTERPDFEQRLARMRSRLVDEDGRLVLFHPDALRVEMPPLAQITAGLTASQRLEDGTIYTSTE